MSTIQKWAGMELVKVKDSALTGETYVSWKENTGSNDAFEMKADRMGLHISGRATLDSMHKLQDFAKLISEGWKESQRLKPHIITNSKDHNA